MADDLQRGGRLLHSVGIELNPGIFSTGKSDKFMKAIRG